MMTRKEQVIAALRHQESESVPFYAEWTEQARDRLAAYLGEDDFTYRFPVCLHCTQYWGWPTELQEQPGHFRDDFGVVWDRTGADKDIGMVRHPIIPDIELVDDYVFPVLDEGRLRLELENLLATAEDKFVMMAFGFSMFERSWTLCGMEEILTAMVLYPDELDRLYDRICTYNERLVDIALEYPVDGIYFGDDWGQQKGLIMGPNHWRRFIKPRMRRLYQKVKQAGRFVFQHSCGDCEELFPDLIEIGLDCYQTFQPEIYDIEKVKQEYGGDLCFWGGISTQQLLPMSDPATIRKEIRRIIKVMKPGGGYIVAPTHALPHDIPPENQLAMLDAFMHQ